GSSVEVVRRNYLVSGTSDIEKRQGDGRLTTGDRQRPDSAIEKGHPFLKDVRRWIHQPRISIAEFFQAKKISRVFGIFELVGGCLINGNRARSRCRIRILAAMQGQCFYF